MTSRWICATVADPTDLDPAPTPMTPREAQRWCPFVLWTPPDPPAGARVLPGTLRREAPPGRVRGQVAGRAVWTENNPASYRFEVVGADWRLRVKQFLYDWAFPALDHPCLWGSPSWPSELDERRLLWHGTDYLARQGAATRLARTTVEISLCVGEVGEDTLAALCRSLRPACADAAASIAATPFAALSYFARHPSARVPHVPIGLWRFRRPNSERSARWSAEPAVVRDALRVWRLPSVVGGCAADSVALFDRPADRAELEVVYADPADRGQELRLIARQLRPGRASGPPEREPHPGQHARVHIAGALVYLAWIDPRYGPWDAVWREPATRREVKLLSGAGVGRDQEWFASQVKAVMAVSPAASATSGAALR